ncbi:MAG: hypothetical protein AABY53_08465 [Bdellovibrionota bacterium]
MKKFLKIIGLAALINLICACAVFKISPEIRDSQYKFKEMTPVMFSKLILFKNLNSGNEEKNEDTDSGVHKINYEGMAANSGIIFSNNNSQYELILSITDASNFNFTTKDYLRSFPYSLWATLSALSLGIIPTRVHHKVSIKASIKNFSTNRYVDIQEEVAYDLWVSIIFAFKGNLKTAPSILNDVVEAAVSSIFIRIKENIDQKNI